MATRFEQDTAGPVEHVSQRWAVAGLFEHNWGDTEVQRVVLAVLALPFCLREVG